MFLESKVTEIYCMADDFCKEFTKKKKKFLIQVSQVQLAGFNL